MTALVRLRGVGKRYGRAGLVLTGLDLDVPRGAVIGIVGTNGSGKSTLLRILARVSRPSFGAIEGMPSLGYLPDRFPASTRMSAIAYLRHLGRISGMSDVDSRAAGLLERLALAGGPRAPIRQLSKGNAQKVGLVQALLTDPELLVLDEPWSGLDPAAHGVLGELIAETRERGASVVFTAHDEDLAQRHTSRVYRVTDGVLRESTPTVRILLRGNGDVPWPEAIPRDGERIELAVPAGRVDKVLLDALQRGWSVLAVTR